MVYNFILRKIYKNQIVLLSYYPYSEMTLIKENMDKEC